MDASHVDLLWDSILQDHQGWHNRYCRSALLTLSRHPTRTSRPTPPPKFPYGHTHVESDLMVDTGDTYLIEDYNTAKRQTVILQPLTVVAQPFTPHPSYESCTPTSRNILVNDDKDSMGFIRYAHSPAYNFETEMDQYTEISWQDTTMLDDPDTQMLLTVFIHRLETDFLLTKKQLSRLLLLPVPLLERILSSPDLRDYPSGTPKLPVRRESALIPHYPPSEVSKYFLEDFCSNLNCTISFCTTHVFSHPLPPAQSPKLTDETSSMVRAPCGMQCFMHPASKDFAVPSVWSDRDIAFLHELLKYSPDDLPCHLAIICRKPCREVQKHRIKYTTPLRSMPPEPPPKASEHRAKFVERVTEFTPNAPCGHDGPCSLANDCECARNQARCRFPCRCPTTCQRRTKGCRCGKTARKASQRLCGTDKCPCYRAQAECEPDVCQSCDARCADGGQCQNVAIQKAQRKSVEVRRGQYGLGLFLLEPCKKSDLIGEYVGELILEATFVSRSLPASYKGRSYAFGLNPRYSVDSDRAGNEMRFMNHSANPNCYTSVRLVNGEHRIGFYASHSLKAGEELLIDYGANFFHSQPQGQPTEHLRTLEDVAKIESFSVVE